MKLSAFHVFLLGAFLSGCAGGPVPQTAEEHRTSFAKDVTTYEVNRPYKSVAKTLQDKSKECLDVHLVKRTCVNRSCSDADVFYRPTIVSNAEKTELHVQWRKDPWKTIFLGGGKPPADGLYIFVFDAEPAGARKTKMTVHGTTNKTFDTVPSAVKRWAEGSNMGCPDLTKPHWY